MKTKLVTTDIYLAAALMSMGHMLDEVDKSDSRHMVFTIKQKENGYTFSSPNISEITGSASMTMMGLEKYEKDWANGALMVNGVAFKNSLQQLKSVIHSRPD